MIEAEAGLDFQLAAFMDIIADDLMETGFIEGFEFCHYQPPRGMRVDGYWFSDENSLDLFIADYDNNSELESLTQTNVTEIFKRLDNFFEASAGKQHYTHLEDTSPEYSLSREIADRASDGLIQRLNCFLFSERQLSERIQAIEDKEIAGIPTAYHIWDISRLHRQQTSRNHKEVLDIDFLEMYGRGLPCLEVHLGSETYQSYLIVIPGEILADLYGKFGSRLLEQNVRSFLQARGNVNKGIRHTILESPEMFFAYNNGITATAQDIQLKTINTGLVLTSLSDLQIVNGGQTTASLFHTQRKDNASLENIFVQMKLSVIPTDESETVVSKISEYANTQNRINAADFFSNHPFHIRMEEFSRRIWAPAQLGSQRETKWFYERARGQYTDEQSKMSKAEQRRFKVEYPKPQMFTKTDLAKFENVWDDHPRWVNLGAQKNFARYAERIGKEWENSDTEFNEFYYRRSIARALIFRCTEKLVSAQSWYNGGYRANIVAYAIALISKCSTKHKKAIDFQQIWNTQTVPETLTEALAITAKFAHDDITNPPEGISNISEWCKKEGCWQRLCENIDELEDYLPQSFWDSLITLAEQKLEEKKARKTQRFDDEVELQKRVFEITPSKWKEIFETGEKKKLFTQKESGVLKIALQMPAKVPTEKQCMVLVQVLEKAEAEGVLL